MEDAANTTIGIALLDFQRKYLPMSRGFKRKFPAKLIQTISDEFRTGWNEAQKPGAGRTAEQALSEVWAKVDHDHDGLCPGHFLHLSENKYEGGDESKYKIDGSYIRKEDKPQLNPGLPNWALQRLSVEFKRRDTGSDPYDDRVKGSIEAESESRQKMRGEIMSYAKHVFHYQHRTALFFLFVNGNTFRMMRWDRSGVIVSAAEDYLEDPKKTGILLELLHSFSKMSAEDQGLDTTAEPLPRDSCGWRRMDALAQAHDSDLESKEREVLLNERQVAAFLHPNSQPHAADMFAERLLHMNPTTSCAHARDAPAPEYAPPVFTEVRTFFRNSISSDFPRYVLKVGDRRFLVGKPIFCASGMVGRGTRGYVALDWGTQRFVFLKDAWRPYYEELVPEGETLRKLNENGVCGVPTHVCDGDVPNQETETSNYSVTGPYYKGHYTGTQKQCSELRHLHHYRLVVEEVCLPSTEFENVWQLTSIIYTCIQAHSAAYTLCGIIHRDVSAGNILILPKVVEDSGRYYITRVGILSDWELSKDVGITHDMQPHRTGTWPFMARRCIDDPHAIVGVPEEIESFLYVHLYHATRFLPTSIPPPIYYFMTDFFDGYEDTCPPAKTASVQRGRLTYNGKPIELQYRDVNGQIFTHPCNALLEEIFIHLKARYDMLDLLEAQAHQPARITQPEIAPPPAPAAPHNPEDPAEVAPAVDAPSGSNAPAVDPVPAEMRSRAEKLDTHDWVLSVFDKALCRPVKRWPKQDKIEDQLARYKLKEWHSIPSADVPLMGASGGKRLRGSEDSGDTRAPRAKKAKKGKKGMASTEDANGDGSTEADESQEQETAKKPTKKPARKPVRKAQNAKEPAKKAQNAEEAQNAKNAKEVQESAQKENRGYWRGKGPGTRARARGR
ncbi:hypothetical protein C8Q74DRAFT_1205940 [Fomes fomentarius]|nr:hypothetical protein C8Q74DRAFT_1205940 [Fomes fomentarius]